MRRWILQTGNQNWKLNCPSPLSIVSAGPIHPSPPASEARTQPRPVVSTAPPRLLAPSPPPSTIDPSAPPGSLVPPAPPWSGFDHSAPWDSTPLALSRPSGSIRLLHPLIFTLVLSCSGSAADLWISASVARALGSTLAPHILGIPPGSLAVRLCLGLHLLRRFWSAPWSRQLFLYGSSHHRLHLGPS